MALPPLCEELYQQAKLVAQSSSSILNVSISKIDSLKRKVDALANDLDLEALLATFHLPTIQTYTAEELLDQVLNCPILSCVINGMAGIINVVNQYVAAHGTFDPYHAPQVLLDAANVAVVTMNAELVGQAQDEARKVLVDLSKSPLGAIGRWKIMLDNFTSTTGMQALQNVTNTMWSCLITRYPPAEQDPDYIAFQESSGSFTYNDEGNIQIMSDANEATMAKYNQLKADLITMSTGTPHV